MNQYLESYVDENAESTAVVQFSKARQKKNVVSHDSILQFYKPVHAHGQIIGKIASSFFFVYSNEKISTVADELLQHEDILAVGVLTRDHKVLGLVSRRDLFDAVGKQFGRDLYKNKMIRHLVSETRCYNFKKNIFSVAQDLAGFLDSKSDKFFLLLDDEGNFSGIFSGKDLLVYLSEITNKDIMLAKTLQSCIVKDEVLLKTDTCEIVGATRMAKGVGGDYYSIQNYEKNKWFLNVCDVSGKGISASLVSAILGGMSSIYDFTKGVKNYLQYVNSYIFNSLNTEKFITGLFVDFNEIKGTLKVYDLGHSYMFIYRKNKILRINDKARMIPIGVTANIDIVEIPVTLQKGDMVILMSDGIEDQENAQGVKFGLYQVFKLIRKNKSKTVKEIKNILFDSIKEFRGEQTQNDDITLILMKYE